MDIVQVQLNDSVAMLAHIRRANNGYIPQEENSTARVTADT